MLALLLCVLVIASLASSLPSVAAQSGVQFSFCLITGTTNASGGAQSAATFTSVSWGVFTTTNATYSSVGAYTISDVVGQQYSSASSVVVAAALPPFSMGADNRFYLNGSSTAAVDEAGIVLGSLYGIVRLYQSNLCGYYGIEQVYYGAPCAPYGQLTVQPYNSSSNATAAPPPTCQPTPVNETVQFAFCLITGTAAGYNQSAATFLTVSTGVFTTTTTVYSVPAVYALGSILNGVQYSSTNSTPVVLTLGAPNALPGPNDNLLTLVGSPFAPNISTAYYRGIGLESAYSAFTVASTLVYFGMSATYFVTCAPTSSLTSVACGYYALLTVALYNAGDPALQCQPLPLSSVVQFSFCLVTSNGTLSPTSFKTVSFGIFTTTSTTFSPSSTYTAGSIVSGWQYTSANSTPTALSLVAPGMAIYYSTNDNAFTLGAELTPGVFNASTDARGLTVRSLYTALNVYNAGHVACLSQPSGACGTVAQLTVGLYDASTGATIPCGGPPSSASSSSSSAAASIISSASGPAASSAAATSFTAASSSTAGPSNGLTSSLTAFTSSSALSPSVSPSSTTTLSTSTSSSATTAQPSTLPSAIPSSLPSAIPSSTAIASAAAYVTSPTSIPVSPTSAAASLSARPTSAPAMVTVANGAALIAPALSMGAALLCSLIALLLLAA